MENGISVKIRSVMEKMARGLGQQSFSLTEPHLFLLAGLCAPPQWAFKTRKGEMILKIRASVIQVCTKTRNETKLACGKHSLWFACRWLVFVGWGSTL